MPQVVNLQKQVHRLFGLATYVRRDLVSNKKKNICFCKLHNAEDWKNSNTRRRLIVNQNYNAFFLEFGHFLKEGVVTDFNNKGNIAKLLRFESSSRKKEDDLLSSFDDYISRCPVTQNNRTFRCIYYFSFYLIFSSRTDIKQQQQF